MSILFVCFFVCFCYLCCFVLASTFLFYFVAAVSFFGGESARETMTGRLPPQQQTTHPSSLHQHNSHNYITHNNEYKIKPT